MSETKRRVRVIHDPDASSPRDNDNLGVMATWHKRYTLGDEQPTVDPQEYRDALPEAALILPLYLLDHGGLVLRTTSFGDPWDSGQIGWISVTRDKLIEEYGNDGPDARATAQGVLETEVEEYSQYINGETFGFVIEEGKNCDLGHEHWEQVDAYWGFIGSDPMTNGMSDSVPDDLHEALKTAAQNPEGR